jgi:hypothetical protein
VPDDVYGLLPDEKRLFDELADWWRTRTQQTSLQARGSLGELPPMRLGKAKERILTTGATATGKVNLWEVSTAGAEVATTGSTENVSDWFGTGASSSEKVVLQRHRQSGRQYMHAWPTQRCVGKLAAALDSSNTTGVNVDAVKPLWGGSPTTSTGATLSVANPTQFSATDNSPCRFEYNKSSSKWEFYGMPSASTAAAGTTHEVIIDFRVTTGTTCKLEVKKMGVTLTVNSTSTGWVTKSTVPSHALTYDLQVSSNLLQHKTKQIHGWLASTSTGWKTWHTGTTCT